MSPTLSDEDLIRSLRARTDVALPPMSVDPVPTVTAGRRYRRRRSAATTSTAVVGVAVLAVGVALGGSALLAPRPQQPTSIGQEATVALPGGILATNRLDRRVDADGRPWWDTGLEVSALVEGEKGERQLNLGLDVLDPAEVSRYPRNVLADTGVELVTRTTKDDQPRDALAYGPTGLTWTAGDSAASYAGLEYASTMDVTFVRHGDFPDNQTVIAGAVPAGIDRPRVVIYFPSGLRVGGDPTVYFVEVPTVRSPTDDDRLIYIAALTPYSTNGWGAVGPVDQDGAWLGERAFTIVVGADGAPFLNAGCTGSLAECAAVLPDGGDGLRAAIASIGGRTDG